MSEAPAAPTLTLETRLWATGHQWVAGLDEAGRGAWAGPVVAGAVILPADGPGILQHLAGVRDSKMLTALQRQRLFQVIQDHAVATGVGVVPPEEIDRLGIVSATRQAMGLALHALASPATYLLIDHLSLPDVSVPQHSLPKGDQQVLSIAAASIVAKVSRDRLMVELEAQYPGYGFAQHKGYGTPQHRSALADLGPSRIHRMSFAPLRVLSAGPSD
jgi:ribonuclease HII